MSKDHDFSRASVRDYTRSIAAMDQKLSEQLLTSNDKGYQALASLACTDPDNLRAVHYYAHQPFACNIGDFEGMCPEMSPQIYNSTGAIETVEKLSTAMSLEHSLPSYQHQHVYLDRTMCSSLGPHDLIPTASCPLTSITFILPTPISDDDPAHDVSIESTTCRDDDAAARRKDRRRAQNRVAQRAYRARKEVTIKESTVKVSELEGDLACLQRANSGLCKTVFNLRAQLIQLQEENAVLKTVETVCHSYC